MSKKLFHAIVYDISNWAFIVSTIMFLWTINHWYTVLLTGLYCMKWIANVLHYNSTVQENEAYKKQMLDQFAAFQKKLQQTEALRPKPELVENKDNVVEFKNPNDKDILQ